MKVSSVSVQVEVASFQYTKHSDTTLRVCLAFFVECVFFETIVQETDRSNYENKIQ